MMAVMMMMMMNVEMIYFSFGFVGCGKIFATREATRARFFLNDEKNQTGLYQQVLD